MSNTLSYNIEDIVKEFARQQTEYKEKRLAEIITKYDFIVGSIECKHKLLEILPDGVNVIYSPYIENPTMVYAIKKFDIMDLLKDPYGAESKLDGEPIDIDKAVEHYEWTLETLKGVGLEVNK